ncbi:MAG TPA: hypothetical protein VER03_13825 [Bryobacteraceae bacterium]|nr:hypothetical protein [Bryobacteraceae bacterium]
MPSSNLKSISVDIEVMTKDRLRKVVFGLDKTTADNGEVTWTIDFRLFEREKKTDEFGDPLVKLDAVVVKKANFDNAEATAVAGRFKPEQTEHALGPAANDAKRFKDGKITREKAEATAERTVAKRG